MRHNRVEPVSEASHEGFVTSVIPPRCISGCRFRPVVSRELEDWLKLSICMRQGRFALLFLLTFYDRRRGTRNSSKIVVFTKPKRKLITSKLHHLQLFGKSASRFTSSFSFHFAIVHMMTEMYL